MRGHKRVVFEGDGCGRWRRMRGYVRYGVEEGGKESVFWCMGWLVGGGKRMDGGRSNLSSGAGTAL